MSQETRTIRPFVGLASLPAALGETLLHFGSTPCAADSSIQVDVQTHEFLLRPVTLEWASDDEAFDRFKRSISDGAAESGLDTRDLALVVVASTAFLKIAEVVHYHSLSALDEMSRTVDLTSEGRPRPFSAPGNGFSVEAYLLLANHVKPRPLQPYRKGTWLARTRFVVDTRLAAAILPPVPLTAETRARLNLPPKTLRYIEFGSHDLFQPYRDQEQPVLYVDESLLAQLNARRASAVSRAIQVQLVHDFVSAVVWRAARSKELDTVSYADIRTSLLGSIIRIAAGSGASDETRRRMLGMAREMPEDVIAAAEHSIDIMSAFGRAMKDGEGQE